MVIIVINVLSIILEKFVVIKKIHIHLFYNSFHKCTFLVKWAVCCENNFIDICWSAYNFCRQTSYDYRFGYFLAQNFDGRNITILSFHRKLMMKIKNTTENKYNLVNNWWTCKLENHFKAVTWNVNIQWWKRNGCLKNWIGTQIH